jgi:beta-lactamase superfamily II metal-dependent hydrolase
MKPTIILAALCAISLILLFGCALPGEAPKVQPAGQGGLPQPPSVPSPPAPPLAPDVPVAWGNQTPIAPAEPENVNTAINESNASTENQTVVEEGPVKVGRNISDRIEEGEFSIKKTPFEPLHIYVINDSNADSILVRKGSFTMLIDAGNFLPVRKMLDELFIERINVLVATRDDPGAINGMEDMIYGYAVDEFWDNNVTPTSKEYKAALAAVAEKKITVKHPQEGDNLTVNGLDIRILNPQKQRMRGNPDSDAIVMRLGSGKFCAMLLNPTVQERETALIGRGVKTACPVATFFKHGEGRPVSSLLIEGNSALKDVIISVGENDEGLPSDTTLTRLSLKDYRVWRTDLNGTIDIYADWVGNYQVTLYNSTSTVQ